MKNVKEGNIWLQFSILIAAIQALMIKLASNAMNDYGIFNIKFIFFIAMAFFFMCLYAILWQQTLKKMSLNKAYALKNLYLFWNMLFSVLILHEELFFNNVIGFVLIVIGLLVVIKNE